MTSRSTRLLWIDDDVRGVERSRVIAQCSRQDRETVVTAVHPSDVVQQDGDLRSGLQRLLRKTRPDLIAVDYDLKARKSESGTVFSGRANVVLGAIKDVAAEDASLAEVPVYLVTSHLQEKHDAWAYSELSTFDCICTAADVASGRIKLGWEARQYRHLRRLSKLAVAGARDGVAVLSKALKVPRAAMRGVELIYPERLRSTPQQLIQGLSFAAEQVATSRRVPPSLSDVAKWIRNELMLVPGPLLDAKRSGMLLGITESAFRANAEQLRSAGYRGVFSTPDRGLWWRDQLIVAVVQRTPRLSGQELARRAHELLSIAPRDKVLCYIANLPDVFAETIAYQDNMTPFTVAAERAAIPVSRRRARVDPEWALGVSYEPVYRYSSEQLRGSK